MPNFSACTVLVILLLSCKNPAASVYVQSAGADTVKVSKPLAPLNGKQQVTAINTGKTTPSALLAFAVSLKGIPYKYGSADPKQGFDCSGFVTYVFNHFGIAVPRSSADFTHVNRSVDLKNAKTGDLILFTGTDSTIKTVGHMGILIAGDGNGLSFIHATSGKAYGVTQTPLNTYYMGRYMKTIRIFPQNNH